MHNPLLASAPPLDEAAIRAIDTLMRSRWGALFSIDDLVAQIVGALDALQLLQSTYVMVSSDHGYHLGQFRIPDEKMLPYETDVRVPLWVRGPGIAAGRSIPQLAANIDLAPTLLALAKLRVPEVMDGKSLLPLLLDAPPQQPHPSPRLSWRTAMLSEFAEGELQVWGTNSLWMVNYTVEEDRACGRSCGSSCPAHPPFTPAGGGPQYIYDTPQNQWRMLRVINETHDLAFVEWDPSYVFSNASVSFREFFDLRTDPWQQTNAWSDLSSAVQAALKSEIERLSTCRGGEGGPSTCP